MKTISIPRRLLWLALLAAAGAATAQSTIGTGFTFQGELRDNGVPGNGNYDFRARLFAPGVGTPLAESVFDNVVVAEGRFALPLDFTELPFRSFGDSLSVEIAARSGASTGAWTLLGPRITPESVPYALAARTVMPGSVGSTEIDPQQVQQRVFGSCLGNTAISAIAADGSVVCDVDDAGVSVVAGFGLLGGGNDGAVPLAINPVEVQRRVGGICAAGSSIRTINEDGSVECEIDDGAGAVVTVTALGSFFGGGGSTSSGGAVAVCASGLRALGGGFQTNCGGLLTQQNSPSSSGQAWIISMVKRSDVACPGGTAQVTAYALCAPL